MTEEEKIVKRVRQMHEKYNQTLKKLGYDEASLEEFLEWLEDLVEDV